MSLHISSQIHIPKSLKVGRSSGGLRLTNFESQTNLKMSVLYHCSFRNMRFEITKNYFKYIFFQILLKFSEIPLIFSDNRYFLNLPPSSLSGAAFERPQPPPLLPWWRHASTMMTSCSPSQNPGSRLRPPVYNRPEIQSMGFVSEMSKFKIVVYYLSSRFEIPNTGWIWPLMTSRSFFQ